jgi:hypothetical protein
MPFDSAPKELYGLVEEKLGGWVAKLLLLTFVGGAIAGGLGTIGLVAYQAHTKVIQPMLTGFPATMPQGAFATVLISTAVTTLLLIGPTAALARILRKRELRLFKHVDAFLSGRLENIELRLDDFEERGRERFQSVQSQLDALPALSQPKEAAESPTLPTPLLTPLQRLAGMVGTVPVVTEQFRIHWKPHGSGLSVAVTNLKAEEIVNPRLQIADARKWSATVGEWVKVQEVTVTELLDHPTLYCDQEATFRCLDVTGEKLRAVGYLPLDPRSPNKLDLRGAGQWRITFKLKWDGGGGGRSDFHLFLEWDGHGLPKAV